MDGFLLLQNRTHMILKILILYSRCSRFKAGRKWGNSSVNNLPDPGLHSSEVLLGIPPRIVPKNDVYGGKATTKQIPHCCWKFRLILARVKADRRNWSCIEWLSVVGQESWETENTVVVCKWRVQEPQTKGKKYWSYWDCQIQQIKS